MDIGARGGIDRDLWPAAWATTAVGFEPEPQECARLNCAPPRPWRSVRYVPTALGESNRQQTLNIPKSDAGASLLSHNSQMVPRFGHVALHRTIRTVPVETLTLDSACDRFALAPPDYLKVDVEGAELQILEAAPNTLANCLAVKVEASFLEQRVNQPLIQELLTFMQSAGFLLGEIRDIHHWRRRPLPGHPYSAIWVVPYSRGIAAQCDLVFLRDPDTLQSTEKKLRLVLVSAILGFFDHGVTVLRSSPDLESQLNTEMENSFLGELGLVSRRMGRAVALSEAMSRLRGLAPLARSLLFGIRTRSPREPGY
ncbi:FkbM family methyltransferase [Thioflavicoccus mobilis]